MRTTPNPHTERTDAPADESSPSCGYAEMAEIMGCPLAHTVDAGEINEEEDSEEVEVPPPMRRETAAVGEVAL